MSATTSVTLVRFLPVLVAVLPVVLSAIACGRKLPPTASLSGKVMRAGTRVQDGEGVLHPLDQPGGSSVGFVIKAGRFEAPVVPRGRYRVELWSDKAFTPAEMDERPRIPNPPPVVKNRPQGEIEVGDDADELTIDLR